MTELTLDAPVRTARLELRAFRDDDLDEVHELRSDPDVVRYIPWEVGSREESRAWLAERIAQDRLTGDGDAVAWAVVDAAGGALLGSVNAWWRSVVHRQAEIGFVLGRSAQGHGYGAEATTAVVDLLFDRLPVHRVIGRADARNTASARLMTRIGMRQEAHLRDDEWFKGEWTDTVVFAVLRHEWQASRGG
jgi:RimJ/RimL family protein N-acetyltransferase